MENEPRFTDAVLTAARLWMDEIGREPHSVYEAYMRDGRLSAFKDILTELTAINTGTKKPLTTGIISDQVEIFS